MDCQLTSEMSLVKLLTIKKLKNFMTY